MDIEAPIVLARPFHPPQAINHHPHRLVPSYVEWRSIVAHLQIHTAVMAARLCALPGAATAPHHLHQRGALRTPMLPGPGLRRARQALGQQRCTCSAAVADAEVEETAFLWKGADEFTELDDRKDAQPLALPAVSAPLRVVLVRHGQSTWNASGRIQGSSDFAVLTPKGEAQADTTRQMVRCLHLTSLEAANMVHPFHAMHAEHGSWDMLQQLGEVLMFLGCAAGERPLRPPVPQPA